MAENTQTLNESLDTPDNGDSIADAVAAVALVAIFVVTCIYWVSGQ